MTTQEEWRPVADYPGYEVSDLGRVRSLRRPNARILRPGLNANGYWIVALQQAGRQRTVGVHRLVSDAFIGPLPEGLVTRHLNGNALDNRAVNLKYGTGVENEQDKARHGRVWQTARTHCPQGHPYDDANTRHYRGRRYCRACQNDRNAGRYPQPVGTVGGRA